MITLKPPPAANHTPHEIVQNAAGDCISIHLFLEEHRQQRSTNCLAEKTRRTTTVSTCVLSVFENVVDTTHPRLCPTVSTRSPRHTQLEITLFKLQT